ncbi:hypothetical protein CWM47_00445 [Spirosoma pollinicola]|uniref:histidine kinase n=1 Tax=Spirosoma pollinicola TaxID=2057025 RepID=A0A2K8YS25_9BACT|nr:hypothetical protein CWM47_00445 [Spirosoma pollinicola]
MKVFDTKQPLSTEHYYPEFDTWREVKIVRVPTGIMITYNDITAVKKTMALAQQQVHILDEVINQVPMGIAVMNAVRQEENNHSRLVNFQFVRINRLLEEIFRQPGSSVEGQLLTSVLPNAEASGLLSRAILAIEDKHSITFELPFTIEQKVRWFTISISPKADQLLLAITDITQTKLAQLAHHQQAELLNSVLNGSQHAIVAFDAVRDSAGRLLDFRYVLQNKVHGELTGLSDRELLGRTLLDLIPQTQENGLLDNYIALVETGKPFKTERTLDFGCGPGWYDLSAVKRGNGFVLTIQDKTVQKLAQEQVQQQALLLETINNSTPAGLVLWEAIRDNSPERTILDFRYRMSNPMNTYITGYSAEALLGQDLLTLFPRFRGGMLDFALRETLRTGQSQRMILTDYTDSSAGWFDTEFSLIGNSGSTDRVLMTYMDVTEAHKTQLAQRQHNELMKLIMDTQPSGMVLFEPVRETAIDGQPGRIIDFIYKLVNETQRRTTNRSDHELINQRVRTLFPGKQGQELFDSMVIVAESGQPKEWLMPFFSDGIQGWFQSSLIQHGNQILFTFLDVTNLKHQQQALETANYDLRRSNDNLQKFAYVASHDLQEPLRKIQSFGSILAATYAAGLDEAGLDIIERMQSAAQRMSKLIKHLLAYSRINTQLAKPESVNLSDLLGHIVDDLSVTIQESAATLHWDELPILHGDKTQLQQLFSNLLSNALKYRLPGVSPRIQITARLLSAEDLPAVARPTLGATSMETGNIPLFYEINVIDNGIGFDEKFLDRIFQVFQRLHGKDVYVGTGIGLAICQKVVENHNGAITATSQPGEGATFRVYLPKLLYA